MKRNMICTIIFFILILLTGCGSGGTEVITNPTTPVGDYKMSGHILDSDEIPTETNTTFYWNANPSKSFATDSNGNYTFIHPGTTYYDSYMSFSSSGLEFSVSWDFQSLPEFNAPYIYVIGSNPFSIDSNITSIQRHELVVIARYIEEEQLTTAKNQIETLILSADANSEYGKYLRIIRDFILLKQDFSNLNSIVTETYFSRLYISQDMYTSRQYYGGLLYVMKILLSDDRASRSMYFSDCITFLENINADNISFNDNNAKFLGLSSDDIKAMLLLAYIFVEDQTGIEKFSGFTPDDQSSFAYQILNLLKNTGYTGREKSN